MSLEDSTKCYIVKGQAIWMAAFLAMAINSIPVQAGSMSVWPLRVNLSPSEHVRQVHVTNDADESAYMQATISDWWTAETGEVSGSVSDVIAVPPVFELGPGETQVVRLAYRTPDEAKVERAFRLEIMEVPKTVGLLPNTAVIATRMVLPVFFSPADSAPTPVWTLRQQPLKDPELVIENKGTAHINIKSVEVVSQQDDALTFTNSDGDIVLPAKEKSWKLSASFANAEGPIAIKAETNIGPIETVVMPPNG